MLVEIYQFRVRTHDPLLASLRVATVDSRGKRLKRKERECAENCPSLQQNGASRHRKPLLDRSSMRKSVGERSNDGSFSGSFSLAILDDLILNSPHVAIALRRKVWQQHYMGPRRHSQECKSEVPFHPQLLTYCRETLRKMLMISLLSGNRAVADPLSPACASMAGGCRRDQVGSRNDNDG
jgi:hypothetical protein